jgi:O-methyltransferase
MKRVFKKVLNKFGYDLVYYKGSKTGLTDIIDEDFWKMYEFAKPYTMTSCERMFALYQATNFILDQKIQGDFVECGVWRGGSSLLMAQVLQKCNERERLIYLYDTFEGMSSPTEHDKDLNGKKASHILEVEKEDKENSTWCLATLSDVQNNLSLSNLPQNQLRFVKGKVEETIPAILPNRIALLRLDTDWYESTKHELENLFDIVSPGGIVILDDYGHWQGARKAVDEFLTKRGLNVLLNRIDYSGRMFVKPF